MRKAKVAFFASAGAPPLGQTLIQRSETLSQGGLLLIGPEGGVNLPPLNPFARSVIEKS